MDLAEPRPCPARLAPLIERGHELRADVDQVKAVGLGGQLQAIEQFARRGAGQERLDCIPVGADDPLGRRRAEQVLEAQRGRPFEVAHARGAWWRRDLPQADQFIGEHDTHRPAARGMVGEQRGEARGQCIRREQVETLLGQQYGRAAEQAVDPDQSQAIAGNADAQGVSKKQVGPPKHAGSPA